MNRKLISLLLALLMGLLPLTIQAEEALHAPTFEMHDQYGTTWRLEELEGKLVFLNFFTTWCPWCLDEMQDFQAVYEAVEESGADVLIFGVASPSVYDTADEEGVIAFLEEQGITYPVLMDPTGEYFAAWGLEGFPTSVLIGGDGTVLKGMIGAMESGTLESWIRMAMPDAFAE